MAPLIFAAVTDAETARAWQRVHNEVIPPDPLSLEQVKERSKIRFLDVAHLGSELVGCATIRPANDEDPVTVIVRILPPFRRQGLGSQYLSRSLSIARTQSTITIQTIVLASNVDGLEFALHRGFMETERYTPDGHTVPYIVLVRTLEGLPIG